MLVAVALGRSEACVLCAPRLARVSSFSSHRPYQGDAVNICMSRHANYLLNHEATGPDETTISRAEGPRGQIGVWV
eukprot:4317093-Pyramimonas_sp.AAC.1